SAARVLFLVVCGTIACGDDYKDIVDWGVKRTEFYHGIPLSPSRGLRPTNLQFEVPDAITLLNGDASLTGAAAQLVLNFVPDPIAVLHEIRRVTVPGSLAKKALVRESQFDKRPYRLAR